MIFLNINLQTNRGSSEGTETSAQGAFDEENLILRKLFCLFWRYLLEHYFEKEISFLCASTGGPIQLLYLCQKREKPVFRECVHFPSWTLGCSTDPSVFPLYFSPLRLYSSTYSLISSKDAKVSMRRAHNRRYDYLKLVQTYCRCFNKLTTRQYKQD